MMLFHPLLLAWLTLLPVYTAAQAVPTDPKALARLVGDAFFKESMPPGAAASHASIVRCTVVTVTSTVTSVQSHLTIYRPEVAAARFRSHSTEGDTNTLSR
jgi:hypothetical protein